MKLPLGAALLALLAATPAWADDLRVAMKGVVDNADPHQSYTPNRNVQIHVYEPLLFQDEHLRPHPGLAESWRAINPTTWEFTLRAGVKFHDGSPLTPADVAFSLMRAKAATGIRTYAASVRNVVSVEPTGERTFLIHNSEPTPLQPEYLTTIGIVSAKAAANATNADWNGGRAAIGTGPYKWVRWIPGQEVDLVRNDDYWGAKEPWEHVTFRFIPNDGARVAALLSGDVDVADTLPAELYDRVKSSAQVKLITTDSIFTNYLYIDGHSPRVANATDADGKVLPSNPLLDLRVREAMDHALNRSSLADRAMQGGATAAGQIAAPGLIGNVPDLKPAAYDPALSKQLLADAGYPKGFTLGLTCTNDRFAGDSRTCQAVGQMLTAVGIRAQVDAMPSAIYFRRWATYGADGTSDFTATISMFGSSSGLGSEGMNTIIRTADPERGLGGSNRRFVSDAKLDGMLTEVDGTFDEAEREKRTQDAVRYAMDQRDVLPLFFVKASWGIRKDLTMTPRADQYTLATTVRKAP
ncbi:ABC transporter substrate-binding protein [Acidisphaera sp. L21]|uniref:ABC transporter substrate-binding protein n=1 Tax=Acidisphaera sp. L21 TaxID=1641851 RepID=UPI00131C1CF3|nr:ABC transporter substrate-binding protein [Acidisphaera sp. L21]